MQNFLLSYISSARWISSDKFIQNPNTTISECHVEMAGCVWWHSAIKVRQRPTRSTFIKTTLEMQIDNFLLFWKKSLGEREQMLANSNCLLFYGMERLLSYFQSTKVPVSNLNGKQKKTNLISHWSSTCTICLTRGTVLVQYQELAQLKSNSHIFFVLWARHIFSSEQDERLLWLSVRLIISTLIYVHQLLSFIIIIIDRAC